MNMLRKIIDCKSSIGNVYDGVYFRKVANLHYTGCKSTINRVYHGFSLEYTLKNSCLIKNILRKRSKM